jgi:hypothetical protein
MPHIAKSPLSDSNFPEEPKKATAGRKTGHEKIKTKRRDTGTVDARQQRVNSARAVWDQRPQSETARLM